MTKVTIDREPLERIDESAICDGTDATISDDLFTQLVAALDAPRQPEGDGLQVVAWQDAENPLYTTAERRVMHEWTSNDYLIVELCRLSDAQRAIAELREECERLRNCLLEVQVRHFSDSLKRRSSDKELEQYLADGIAQIESERDTLRQQLAERDAQIASMRAEVTPFIETHWRPVAEQRDRLAELLREAGAWIHGVSYRYAARHPLLERIDTALAEVKPCPESPAPTT